MERSVICVSKSLAAGGEEIGRLVAEKTRYRYADEEIIIKAAQSVGVSAETVAEAEHTPGLVARILQAMGTAPAVMGEGYVVLPSQPSLSYERLIERVVQRTADEGDVVIVAHGGSMALAGREGVLRVLVTASPALRVERLVEQGRMEDGEAKKAVDESDRQRRQFLRRFYHIEHELPTHYDLVLNTDNMTPARAAELTVSAAGGAP